MADDVTSGDSRIQALIITGMATGHHNTRQTTENLRTILEDTGRFRVKVTEEFRGAGPETLEPYDVVILNYFGGEIINYWDEPEIGWGHRAEHALADFVRSGRGLVVYHASNLSGNAWDNDDFERMVAGVMRPSGRRAPNPDFVVDLVDWEHPITKGLGRSFQQHVDDFHVDLTWHPEVTPYVLATSVIPEDVTQSQPAIWTTEFGTGRVFVNTLGHGYEAMASAGFRSFMTRGTEWAATGTVSIPPLPGFAAAS